MLDKTVLSTKQPLELSTLNTLNEQVLSYNHTFVNLQPSGKLTFQGHSPTCTVWRNCHLAQLSWCVQQVNLTTSTETDKALIVESELLVLKLWADATEELLVFHLVGGAEADHVT